ncbi:MAG: GtrA family protein [Firmicutes bacterium]|nr:GtrA family protein [Bacillota bacterium]
MSTYKQQLKKEATRSILAGTVSNLLDYAISGLLLFAYCSQFYDGFWGMLAGHTQNGLPYTPPTSVYLFATFLGGVFAYASNYLLSIFYVFRYGHIGKRRYALLLFVGFIALSIAITLAGSTLLHTLLGINIWIVKTIMVVVVFFLNFFVRRKYIFNIDRIRSDDTILLPQSLTPPPDTTPNQDT